MDSTRKTESEEEYTLSDLCDSFEDGFRAGRADGLIMGLAIALMMIAAAALTRRLARVAE